MIKYYELQIRHTSHKWAMNEGIYFNFTKCTQPRLFFSIFSFFCLFYLDNNRLNELAIITMSRFSFFNQVNLFNQNHCRLLLIFQCKMCSVEFEILVEVFIIISKFEVNSLWISIFYIFHWFSNFSHIHILNFILSKM